jgi:hypothetical protein
MIKLSLTVLALLIAFNSSFAQLSGGIFIGGANYQGDLVKGIADFKSTKARIGVFGRKVLSDPHLAVRAALSFGEIAGDDAHYSIRKERGLSFKSPLSQFSAHFEWLPFIKTTKTENLEGGTDRQKSAFISFGFGANVFDPVVTGLTKASKDFNKKIPGIQMMLPIGVGYYYDIDNKWAMTAEFSSQLAFTDYLDGVSWSGNPNNNDWTMTFGLTIAYKLGVEAATER